MNWQHQPVIYISLASAVIAGVMVKYGWEQRQRPSRAVFVVAQILVIEMAVTHVLQLSRTDLAGALLAMRAQMVGVATVPMLLLLSVVPVNMRRSPPATVLLAALCFVPLVTLYLFLLRPFPNIMVQGAWMANVGRHMELALEPGPWFWIHSVYSYGLVLAGLILVGERLLHHPAVYRRRPLFALSALLFVNLGHVGINLAMLQGRPSDIVTALTIGLLSAAMWVAFKYNIFDVLPLARDQVLQHLPEGILTLDAMGNILDANEMALRYVGEPLHRLVHRPAKEALASMPQLAQALDHDRHQVDLGVDHDPQVLDTSRIEVLDANQTLIGTALVMRDITAEVLATAKLHELGRHIPLCAWCGNARTSDGSWTRLANWLRSEGGIIVSHCICDRCKDHYDRDPNWKPPLVGQ